MFALLSLILVLCVCCVKHKTTSQMGREHFKVKKIAIMISLQVMESSDA